MAPRMFAPASTEADLQDVKDAVKRHELQDSRLKLQNDVRATLLQALFGAVVALGGYFTYQQLKTSRQQVAVALQGQVTERFTRAVDQLVP
jgi:hypothetical protein